MGSNLYISGSVQLVGDLHENVGIQFRAGTDALAGVSAKGITFVAVYPGTDKITYLDGGGDIGGCFGEVFVGGISALYAVEGHLSMGNTFPTIGLGNIATGKWGDIYQK